MSLYEGVKVRVKMDFELSEEFEVEVGMHQGSVLSSFLFAVADVVSLLAREGVPCERMHANVLVLMSERIVGNGIG